MPKEILEFNIPEDEELMLNAINGSRWRFLVQEFEQGLKYSTHTAQEIRDELNALIVDSGLKLFS